MAHRRWLGLTVLSLTGCAHVPSPATPPAVDPATRYVSAVADASEPTSAEIHERLVALSPDVGAVGNTDGAPRARVVTWTSWEGYDAHVGGVVPLGRETWVTVVPELQQACRAFALSGPALSTRLGEYLGLPPGSVKTRMVELSVDPAHVFRPCPDPEVDDTRCELTFPEAASAEHRVWIEALRARSYGADGYPWTQLGYTYDWGRSDTHVGASEFVVRAGATVEVLSVQTTDAYCAPE